MRDRRSHFRVNSPADRAAEFSSGERLDGFAVQFRTSRLQPGLRLPEAQTLDRNRRQFQMRLPAERVLRIPGVLVG